MPLSERHCSPAAVAYDNAGSVDGAELCRFLERAGGMPGPAREIERSAARLGALRTSP